MTNKGIFNFLDIPPYPKNVRWELRLLHPSFSLLRGCFEKRNLSLRFRLLIIPELSLKKKRNRIQEDSGYWPEKDIWGHQRESWDSENTHNSQPLISGFNCVLMSKCYPALPFAHFTLVFAWQAKTKSFRESAYPSFLQLKFSFCLSLLINSLSSLNSHIHLVF